MLTDGHCKSIAIPVGTYSGVIFTGKVIPLTMPVATVRNKSKHHKVVQLVGMVISFQYGERVTFRRCQSLSLIPQLNQENINPNPKQHPFLALRRASSSNQPAVKYHLAPYFLC